jgi:8-oxo-dGTP pyrophosphatase MutT (NUDIX family)
VRQRVLLIGLISISLVALPSTSQAIQSGDSCKKVGSVKKFGGKTFTCVKKNKKSVWRLQKSSSQATTLAGSSVPTPGSSPTTAPGKTSDRLYFEKIRTSAYEAIRRELREENGEKVKLNFKVSNSLPEEIAIYNIDQAKNASKFFGSFLSRTETVNVYLYTEKDAQAIKDDPTLGVFYYDTAPWIEKWSMGQDTHVVIGIAAWFRGGQGHVGLAFSSKGERKSLTPGTDRLLAHEYFHSMQEYFMQCQSCPWVDQDSYDQMFPRTFREGSADTISLALASPTLESHYLAHKELRDYHLKSSPIFATIRDEQSLISALEKLERRSIYKEAGASAYLLGSLIYEWVIGEYGFAPFRKIIENQLIGKSFEENLNASLGMSSQELYSKAAKYILIALNAD